MHAIDTDQEFFLELAVYWGFLSCGSAAQSVGNLLYNPSPMNV